MEQIDLLSDSEILEKLEAMSAQARLDMSLMLRYLAAADRRKAWEKGEFGSTFDYCVGKLRLSEDEAYRRIHVSRAAVMYPTIYDRLSDGRLSLSILSRLVPHLTPKNHLFLLETAEGKTKRQVEAMVADLQGGCPMPPDTVRPIKIRTVAPFLRAPTSFPEEAAREEIYFEYRFVASDRFSSAVERMKDLLKAKHPFGRMEDFLMEALGHYLRRLDPLEQPPRARPRGGHSEGGSRVIPRSVRNRVWARDGGRCVFVGAEGHRCACRRGLQLDHKTPLALGGRSDDENNLRLLCPEHNQSERRRLLGEGKGGLGPGQVRT